MILGFKKQFKAPIVKGDKIHTIREDKNERWHAGKLIHFATGVRTKEYDNFLKDTCKSVQEIEIIHNENKEHAAYDKGVWVLVDNIVLSSFWVERLAINDGFKSVYDFFQWFSKDFKGKIIHWTNLRYNEND